MSIMEVLHSEAVLAAVAGLAGALWTLFKSGEWLETRRRRRMREALRALEAAVEATYREYVRTLKEQHPDGALSLEEQQTARSKARERALTIARERGIDLLKELGAGCIDLWISRLVRKLKGPQRA